MPDIKQKVALSSIAASAGLTVAKAVVGVLSGSLGLLSEAAQEQPLLCLVDDAQ